MKIKVTYTQIYMGERLTDSFTKTVRNIDEARGACERVATDPHVIDVCWSPID
ncbi:hypothetical protein [Lapidilactobacillus dextrinicus]|uniref:hypothetical protein n=1 Tax=Lapidilactobacillus dextrinicus TaxID=51664 RepID=UPI000AA572BB|nr:hypothetical protein [Lapidilactobacillus dextrinicus]